jgi:hypothetical protein
MIGGDGTGSWSYTTNTIRAANGSSANSISIFTGLQEELFDLSTTAYLTGTTLVNQSIGGQIGIGFNSTTAFSGRAGSCSFVNAAGSSTSNSFSLIANNKAPPSLGVNVITALENGTSNAAPQGVWNGSQTNMLLSATYRG